MQDKKDIIQEVVALCEQVGEFQLKHFRKMSAGAENIKDVRETVSFVDVESEKMLQRGLMPLVDGAGFFGEESGKSGSQECVWIVDPLDGTTNYLSGLDQFSVSVALVENNETVLGVVYKPFSGEMYEAVQGYGMRYKGELVSPRFPKSVTSEALFMTGFPYRSPDLAAGFFKAAEDILMLGRGIRRSGSAALDLAQLSAGWIQGFWETDLQPYDVAASMLMMKENGVTVTNGKGESYDMFSDRLMVAALPQVHGELLAATQRAYGDV